MMFAKLHRACAKSRFLGAPCLGHPESHQQAYFGNIAVYGTEANGYTYVAFLWFEFASAFMKLKTITPQQKKNNWLFAETRSTSNSNIK